jgi:hypothetical protein
MWSASSPPFLCRALLASGYRKDEARTLYYWKFSTMKIALVIPIYNDWEALGVLLRAIDARSFELGGDLDVFVIDDASTLLPPPNGLRESLKNIKQVWIVELVCNVGHQRAIAIGLAHVNRLDAYDIVIVMDSDGEDRPEDLPALVQAYRENPHAIVVAQRTQRSEGPYFSAFYFLYKRIFRLMTGREIAFGNFCLMSRTHLSRVVYMPDLWNHLAASILRSRAPIHPLNTARGNRYAGKSSTNLTSLIAHGFSAMAIFSDLLFIRILLFSLIVAIVAGVIAVIALVLRVSTELATPGWATTVIGTAIVIFIQWLTLSTIAAFIILMNRSNLLFVPAVNGFAFIRRTVRIDSSVNRHAEQYDPIVGVGMV